MLLHGPVIDWIMDLAPSFRYVSVNESTVDVPLKLH